MKLYMVEFDNGCQYDDHENYTCGVFDSYEKAETYCLEKGYTETEIKGLFEKPWKYWSSFYKNNLSIDEIVLNQEIEGMEPE